MSDIAQELLLRANQIADGLDAKRGALEKERLEIQSRSQQIEATLNSIGSANKRVLNFRPGLSPNYQCPDCFVKNEVRSTLRPILGTDAHDLLKCPTCKVEIPVRIDG